MTEQTWYEATAIPDPLPATGLSTNQTCDVAIVGGGLAGLSLLHNLLKAGIDAVLVEKDGIADGASGRNGGFCADHWAANEAQITRLVGRDTARGLAGLAGEGLTWMAAKCAQPSYRAAGAKHGILTVALGGDGSAEPAGSDLITGGALSAMLDSPRYSYATLDRASFHFHPLNFMRCLAHEIDTAGGRIFQHTALKRITRDSDGFTLACGLGKISAKRVVLATGGYGGPETRPLSRYILAIRTYIGVTAPLDATARRIINTDYAVGDSRRAGNYYRILADGRLLWGHSITAFGTLDSDRIKANTARDIGRIFPQLDVTLDYGWAGNMAYGVHQMPFVTELEPGLFCLSGFGGHGMNTAPAAALVLAEALAGNCDRMHLFADIPLSWNMGVAGPYAVEAKYRLLQLGDWLAERRG